MKRPEPLKVSREQLEELRQRARTGQLREEDAELVEALAETVAVLADAVQQKSTSIRRLLRAIFGTRSEKKSKLFGKDPPDEPDKPAGGGGGAGTGGAAAGKEKAKGHGRRKADEYTGAERVAVAHPVLSAGDRCPDCLRGSLCAKAPSKLVCVDAAAPFTATLYECERLRCSSCGKTFTAPAPASAAQRKYSRHVGILIALLKYGAGMPFARLEMLQKMAGVPLAASVQWEQVAETAESLWPIFDALGKQAAQGEVLHNDDTTMKVLELMRQSQSAEAAKPGAESTEPRTGVFTTGIVSVCGKNRIALFRTGSRHAGENLLELLDCRDEARAPPIQMCDALSRNMPKELTALIANCLAHARRQFVDLIENFPDACKHVIEQFAEVYKHDAHTREQQMDPLRRLAYHQQHSKPIMDELEKWCQAQLDQRLVEPNSGLGEAIEYLQRHWKPLTLFLREPGAPLDNNVCERALKKAILHRKNSMFYKTLRGARVGDLFMSLIYTCQLNGVSALDYLKAIGEHAANAAADPQHWLPWSYQDAVAALGTR